MQDMNLSSRPMTIMTAVNFCELKISRNPAETLVAFSIGSGIVVSIYDPFTKAGGMKRGSRKSQGRRSGPRFGSGTCGAMCAPR